MTEIFAGLLLTSTTDITDSISDAAQKAVESSKAPLSLDWSSIVTNILNGIPITINILIKAAIALLVILIARKIIHFLRRPIRHILKNSQLEISVQMLFENLIIVLLYIVVFAIVLGIFGIAGVISGLITAIGLVLALALQGSLSNFAGGLQIMVQKPFRVGDFIKEDTHGNMGIVEEIQLGYTKLRTADRKMIIIPNGTLSNTTITNYSREQEIAISNKLPLHYRSRFDLIREQVLEVMSNDPARIPDSPVKVMIADLTDNGYVMEYRMFVKVEDYWNAGPRINEEIRKILLEEELTTPRQEVSVWIQSDK